MRTRRSGKGCPASSGTRRWSTPRRAARSSATHKDISNEFGRLPLLVTRTFGAGKVLFMGTDGAWRWRKGVEDKYHYRFWGQVVRWMAYQRNMAKGETMRLYYVPDQPKMNQTLMLHANVMEPGGEPVRQGEVSARITAPSGKAESVRFRSDGEEWGTFTGRFDPQEPGKYRVVLTCKETKATLEADPERPGGRGRTAGPTRSPRSPRGDRPRLARARWSSPTRSTDHPVARRAPRAAPLVRRLQLWCHPAVAGPLVGLLGLFWSGRKWIGLI